MHRTPTRILLAITMTASFAAAAGAQTGAPGEWHTYDGEGGTRRYRLHVPPGVDPSSPAPLVVMLHGCTQDADDFARGTRFDALADSAGVIVAWPEQTAAHHPQKCWTWYDPAHQGRGAGEPAIIAGIAREVMATHAVDPRRVYVAGVSAGGAMAVNVAASYPELFAAAGVHSGVAYRAASTVPQALAVMRGGAEDESALPPPLADADCAPLPALIVFHGAEDAVVSPANAEQLAGQWARAAGAKDFLRDERTVGGRTVRVDRYGPVMEAWRVEGLGHAWSGGSAEGTFTDPAGPDASREMLRFFLEHGR